MMSLLSFNCNFEQVRKSVNQDLEEEYRKFLTNEMVEKLTQSKEGYYYWLHDSLFNINNEIKNTTFEDISEEDFVDNIKKEKGIRKGTKRYKELIDIAKPILFLARTKTMEDRIKALESRLDNEISFSQKIDILKGNITTLEAYERFSLGMGNEKLSKKFSEVIKGIERGIKSYNREVNNIKINLKRKKAFLKKVNIKLKTMESQIEEARKKIKSGDF
jgi:hypothetical protein